MAGKQFSTRFKDCMDILKKHIEWAPVALENVKVMQRVAYNRTVNEEDRLESCTLAYSSKSDMFIAEPRWVKGLSDAELAYAFCFVLWVKHFNIQHPNLATEEFEHPLFQAAANLRFSLDNNKNPAFLENGKPTSLALEHVQFTNMVKDIGTFVSIDVMSTLEIYNVLFDNIDDFNEQFYYD